MWMSHPSLPGVVKTVLDSAFYGGWDSLGWVVAVAPEPLPGQPPVDAGWTVSQAELDAALTGLSSTYEPVGGEAVRAPMRRLQNKITAMGAGVARVRWVTFGDSYAQKVYLQVAPTLRTAFGGLAGAYFPGSYNGVTNNADSGSVTANTADVALWPSGLTSTLSTAGASRTFGMSGGSTLCDTIRVVHANTGGTFKIQVDGVDNTTPTVTSDNSVTVTTIAVARALHTVTVVQLTGTPKIVGVGFEDSTVPGLVTINVSQGGLNLSTITAQAWTNFATFLTAVTPDVLTVEAKETSATFAATLTALFAATTAAAPTMDVIGIGTPATSSGDSENTATNAQLKTACAAAGYTFYDTYPLLGSYANLVALGWEGDGVHVDVKADAYRGGLLLRDLGIREFAKALEPATVLAETSVNDVTDHAIITVSSATPADVGSGTTVTFTAPLSGKVLVRMSAAYVNDANARLIWNLREGSTDLAGTNRRITTVPCQGTSHYEAWIDGLTPGSSHTYKFGVAQEEGAASTSIYVGPGFSPVLMRVTAR